MQDNHLPEGWTQDLIDERLNWQADEREKRMKGCNKQFYYGTDQYPDHRCVDGNLWDDDNCDMEGNLYVPETEIPCPFCKPGEYANQSEMDAVANLEFDVFKARIERTKQDNK